MQPVLGFRMYREICHSIERGNIPGPELLRGRTSVLDTSMLAWRMPALHSAGFPKEPGLSQSLQPLEGISALLGSPDRRQKAVPGQASWG